MISHKKLSGVKGVLYRQNRTMRFVFALLLTIVVLAGVAFLSHGGRASAKQDGQSSPDGVWQHLDMSAISARQSQTRVLPESFRAYRLNQDLLRNQLSIAPMEFTAAAKQAPAEIVLPMPDGTFVRFQVVQAPMIHPDLARECP